MPVYATPSSVPINSQLQSVILTGVGTAWTSDTIWVITGGSGASISSQQFISPTSVSLVIAGGRSAATLAISNGTDTAYLSVSSAFSPVSPQDVISKCAPLNSIFTILSGMGFDVVTDLIQPCIDSCTSQLQQAKGILLQPQIIKTFPTESDVLGVTYDMTDDQYNYIVSSPQECSVWYTHYRPIISVQQVALQYSPNNPVFTVPAQWIRVDQFIARITIVPVIDPLLGGGGVPLTGYYMPLYSAVTMNVVPNLVTIDYTAGIENVLTDAKWAELRKNIMFKVAADVRRMAWELIPQSHSLDGVSDSFSSTSALADFWDKQWDAYVIKFGQQNAPIMWGIV